MEEVVYQRPFVQNCKIAIIVATAVLYKFIRSQNDPIDEPEHIPAAEEEVPDMYAGQRRLGNAVRQALIMQHFT